MIKKWDVLGFGAVAVDDLLYVDHHPKPDEKLSILMSQRQGGGLTATALVTAARHGARAAYCGRLGDDDLSRYTREEFDREGVDITLTQSSSDSRPFHSTIIVDVNANTRTILYNAKGVAEPDLDFISEDLIQKTRVLFLDHHVYFSGLRASKYARMVGIPVVADIENTDLPDIDLFMSQIDHLIVGIQIARKLTGLQDESAIVRNLKRKISACCVVTDGSNGCWFAQGNSKVVHVPTYPVNVLDTTGCGDVFHGAYAASIARGECIQEAIQIASATAAMKATVQGGRAGIPSLESVRKFIDRNAALHLG